MNSGAENLLSAIEILKRDSERDGSSNMRNLGVALREANSDLGQAWFNIHACFSKTKTIVNTILEGVYVKTQTFSTATIENETMATEAANQFNEISNNYNNTIDSICNKYGVSVND